MAGQTVFVVDESMPEQIRQLGAKIDQLSKELEKHRKEAGKGEAYEYGFMRLPQILEIIPVSKPTWWRWVSEGIAPKGVKLSKSITVWRVEDVRAFAEKVAAEGLEGVQDV
jgi:predicted DNA-binding transcriptional regulator AlpA